jgi:hypothetical protein
MPTVFIMKVYSKERIKAGILRTSEVGFLWPQSLARRGRVINGREVYVYMNQAADAHLLAEGKVFGAVHDHEIGFARS